MKRIGSRLREERGERPLQQVAEAAGVAISTLWRIEKGAEGTPRLATLDRICKQLGVPLHEVIG